MRLREERERVGLTQDAFSAEVGLKRRTQSDYENDRGYPDVAYLTAAGAIGVDIGYLLTGRPSPAALSDDESELLRRYRTAPQALRDGALRLLGASPSAAPSAGIVTHSEVSQVVQGNLRTDSQTFHIGGKKGRSE